MSQQELSAIVCPRTLRDAVSRRAKVKRDQLDVIDTQAVINSLWDLLSQMDAVKANALIAKSLSGAARRRKRAGK